MSNSRNIANLGQYPVPTDTTKTYTLTPGTGFVPAVSGGGSAPLLMQVQDQKPSGTMGGVSTGAFETRALNTVIINQISGASVTGNNVSLPSGVYFVEGEAPSCAIHHRSRIYNVTGSSVVINGTSEGSLQTADYVQTRSKSQCIITASSPIAIRLEHRAVSTGNNFDLGNACGFGVPEVYSEIKIWKLS